VRLSADDERVGPAPAPARGARAVWPWVPVVAYMALIFALSSLSNPLPPLAEHLWDKGMHFVEYGVLGALLALAFRASGMRGWRALVMVVVAASLYGVTDELHQAFVLNRSSDIRDWLADTMGGALGASAAALALRVHRSRASIRPVQRRT